MKEIMSYKQNSDNEECCFVQKSETIIYKANSSKFFWTFNGKIMCRKTMNTATIIIKNEEDINQKLNR